VVKSLQVTEVKPAPVFESWKVIESSSSVKRLNLARFQSAEFDAHFTWNARPRDPIPLALVGIASQTQTGDRNNSINVQAKQISCRTWDDLILPQVRFTLKPAEWKVPELPPEVVAFLASSR